MRLRLLQFPDLPCHAGPHRRWSSVAWALCATLLLLPPAARAQRKLAPDQNPRNAAPTAAKDEDPVGQSTTIGYGVSLLEAWDIEGAEKFAAELEKRAPADPGTKYLLGRIAFEEGEYTKAADLLKEALGPNAAESDDYQLAAAAENEARGTVVEETPHFTIRYKPGKEAALIPYAEQTLEAAYAALTKDLDYAPPRKIRIELYSSPKVLAKVSSLTEEAIKTSGTIALCKYNRLMVTSPRALWRGYEWQDTISHEFTHFLLTRKSHNTVPIWLQEGVAKYLETRWRGPAGLALDPAGEALLARALKQNKLITFAQMHPSIALLPSQEDAATAFAEVFTAVEFMDKRVGMAGVRAVVDNMKNGMEEEQAVAAGLKMPFAQFEAQWKKAIRARPAPKAAPALEKLVFKDERATETRKEREKSYERGELGTLANVEAREHAHLGELLRARGRLQPAALEYEKAIALSGPTHPALARKYALTKLAQGEGAKAEKTLRASLAEYPEDETNHLLLGRVLIETGHEDEAREHLLIANQRDPFDEEIHLGLLAVARKTGDAGLESREKDVLRILTGEKLTWRAAEPGRSTLYGYLRIESPAGAHVLIDGVDTGLTTPVADEPVPAGDHIIRMEVPNGAPVERKVTIVPDTLVPFPPAS
jgi:tetratricopeptide (TPR) repeat protein